MTKRGAETAGEPGGRVIKRSLRIAGHATSISLEEPFWHLLATFAARDGISPAAYVARVDSSRRGGNLSSAIRVHLLERLMTEAEIVIEPTN